MIPFPNLSTNVYPVFQSKSTVIAKKTNRNKKQISIIIRFVYIKDKV